MVTALALVLMLGLGALFVSMSTQYAEETYSLLFGEVFGVSQGEVLPIAALGIVAARGDRGRVPPAMLTARCPRSPRPAASPPAGRLYFLS